MVDTALTHATVVTMNPNREIIRDGAVAIEGNKIIDVGKTAEIKSRHRVDIELDCTHKLVLPGLIDCHVHLAQALIRGCADDMPLIPWLCSRVWPLQGTYTAEEGRLSAQLCCLEMIKSGTTTFVESGLHSRYGFDGIAQAVESIGIRAALSKKLMDITGYADRPDAMPESMVETGEATMRETLTMIQRWHGKANNRIHVWFGARTPGACTVDFYREIGEQARKHRTGVTIHLAEVKQDIEYMRGEFNMTPMQFMQHCGLVGRHVIYAHGVWLPFEDFARLYETGGTVCHCPSSNLKLASGIAPVPKMLKAQVNVALGCDGGPSNNSYDMLREMKLAAILHKGRLRDPEILPAETILEMATLKGAHATLWGEQLGSLEPGKLADLIVIDQRKPHLVPVRNPISNLIYAACGSDVDTVIIDGKIVMEGREVKTIDEEKIIEEAQKRGLEVDERLGLNIGPTWPVI
jgi:cytosine/adenosine deaminase-related metal-dependent hydrolase